MISLNYNFSVTLTQFSNYSLYTALEIYNEWVWLYSNKSLQNNIRKNLNYRPVVYWHHSTHTQLNFNLYSISSTNFKICLKWHWKGIMILSHPLIIPCSCIMKNLQGLWNINKHRLNKIAKHVSQASHFPYNRKLSSP